MPLATRIEEWALQARQEGLQKGLEKGLEKGLQKGLEKGLQKGLQKGLEKGRQEGRTEGEARILQRLLVARFGPLSQETQAALSTASTAQLEAWTDRFLSARTLDEVFAAPTSPSA